MKFIFYSAPKQHQKCYSNYFFFKSFCLFSKHESTTGFKIFLGSGKCQKIYKEKMKGNVEKQNYDERVEII